jgi:hypothetical protein
VFAEQKNFQQLKIDGYFLAKKSGIYSVRTNKNITAWCGAEIKKL